MNTQQKHTTINTKKRDGSLFAIRIILRTDWKDNIISNIIVKSYCYVIDVPRNFSSGGRGGNNEDFFYFLKVIYVY